MRVPHLHRPKPVTRPRVSSEPVELPPVLKPLGKRSLCENAHKQGGRR